MKKINKLLWPLCTVSAGLAFAMPLALTSCNTSSKNPVEPTLTKSGDKFISSQFSLNKNQIGKFKGIDVDKATYNHIVIEFFDSNKKALTTLPELNEIAFEGYGSLCNRVTGGKIQAYLNVECRIPTDTLQLNLTFNSALTNVCVEITLSEDPM